MGSSAKSRTTQAKLKRESKLREKRVEKQARKAARSLTAVSDRARPASHADPLASSEAQHD
jgi:hypothetical protein